MKDEEEIVIPKELLKKADEIIKVRELSNWMPWQVEFLKKYYKGIGLGASAELLKDYGKSYSVVWKMARKLGLTKKKR